MGSIVIGVIFILWMILGVYVMIHDICQNIRHMKFNKSINDMRRFIKLIEIEDNNGLEE